MQIIWPKPLLKVQKDWERNVRLVKWLLSLGKVVEYQKGTEGKDEYVLFPYKYRVFGVKVNFLPHWGFVSMDGYSCPIPLSIGQLLKTLVKVRIGLTKQYAETSH